MSKLHRIEDGLYGFKCPGCKCTHIISYKWEFNGSIDRPTFKPSLKVTSDIICHSYITDGKIKFLSDCTHNLKDKEVEIPEW